ncbi:hypothetical protein BC332_11038 [Capsicum chinense]|nr:hypothetical protein BC332_11038 [Capsicum chinense]
MEVYIRQHQITKQPAWLMDYTSPGKEKGTRYPLTSYLSYANTTTGYQCFVSNMSTLVEPQTYSQAIKDEKWIEAMQLEIKGLEDNHTWQHQITKQPAWLMDYTSPGKEKDPRDKITINTDQPDTEAHQPPTKPPNPPPPTQSNTLDLDLDKKQSLKYVLTDKIIDLNRSYENTNQYAIDSDETADEDTIPISKEEKDQLYLPWQHSVIVKLVGKRIEHQYLCMRLIALWKPTENLILIDLGKDFYKVKFNKIENKNKALNEEPWFIARKFLSFKQWEPNFAPHNSTPTHTIIYKGEESLCTSCGRIGHTTQHCTKAPEMAPTAWKLSQRTYSKRKPGKSSPFLRGMQNPKGNLSRKAQPGKEPDTLQPRKEIDGPNYSPVVKERGLQYPTESPVSTLYSTPSASTSHINLVSPTIPSRDLSNHHLGALDKTSMVESIKSTPPAITSFYQGKDNQNGHLPSNKISTTNEKHQHGNSTSSKQPPVSYVRPTPIRTHSTILAGADTLRHEHHFECISPKLAGSHCIARPTLPRKTGQRLHRSCSPKATEPNVDASTDSSHKSRQHGTSLNRGIQLPNESNISESDILSNRNVINSSHPTLHSLNLSRTNIQK